MSDLKKAENGLDEAIERLGKTVMRVKRERDELLQITKELLEELRLIRMKDTNAVYDPTVRVRAEIAIENAERGAQ